MSEISEFRFPTAVRFGAGARCRLEEFADSNKVTRPLLVTDAGLPRTEAFKLVSRAAEKQWPGSVTTFTEVRPNPTDRDVDAAWKSYREAGCDGVIGLGGGSAIDAARAMRLRGVYPEIALTDIPVGEIQGRLMPFCAIPTTAGTGSEVGRSSVITMTDLGRKAIIGGAPLVADLAILDPELTVGLPPHLTSATGMDALTHSLESLTAPIFHPMCDAIALMGIELVAGNLERAVGNPGDIEARGSMMIAAMMGAVAFQKDLGAAHSMAHPLSTVCGIHHGLANAVCLAPVMRFNREVSASEYARVAGCFGVNVFGMQSPEAADKAIAAVEDLNSRVGIPASLAELGVKEDQLPELARRAFEDPCHQTNPRPCTEQDLLALYREAHRSR